MFLNDVPPCKNCKERFTACHTVCEKYKSWKIDHEIRRKTVRDKERAKLEVIASKIEFTERYWRKIHKKRK